MTFAVIIRKLWQKKRKNGVHLEVKDKVVWYTGLEEGKTEVPGSKGVRIKYRIAC